MNKKVVVSLSASVVAIGILLWLMISALDTSNPDGGSVFDHAIPELVVDGGSAAADAKAAAEADRLDDAKEKSAAAMSPVAGASLHGIVADSRGRGIPDARVFVLADANIFGQSDADRLEEVRRRFLSPSADQIRAPNESLVAVRTDRQGRYAIGVERLGPGSFVVHAAADGFAPDESGWKWNPEGDRLDFQLGAGDSIRGIVRDPSGKPYAGALVSASRDEGRGGGFEFFRGGGSSGVVDQTRSDARGEFVLAVYPGEFRLEASADEFAPASLRGQLSGSEGIVLQLETGRQLAGRVVDESGTPVPGAEVSLYLNTFGGGFGGRGGGRGGNGFGMPSFVRRLVLNPQKLAVSGNDGSFVFNALPSGDFLLRTEKSAFVPEDTSASLASEDALVELQVELEAGRRIVGRVVDPAGAPVVGAFVALGEGGGDRGGFGRGGDRGGDRGGFGRGRGRGEDTEDDPIAAAENAAREAERAVEREREPLSLFRLSDAIETDASGRFSIDTLNHRVYSLSVQSDDFVPRRIEGIDLTEEKEAVVEVVLDPGLRLRGRVISSADGKIVKDASVSLRWRDDRRAVRAPEGVFEIGGLFAGEIGDLEVSARGYAVAFLENVTLNTEPDLQEIEVRVDPVGSIRGRVTDAGGSGVARAQVRVTPRAEDRGDAEGGRGRGRGGRGDFQRFRTSRSTRTDADGFFELLEVQPAPAVELSVQHSDFKEFESEAFSVDPAQNIEGYDVVLASGGQLVTVLLAPEGGPASGVRVMASLVPEDRGEAAEGEDPRGGFGRGGRGGFGGRGGVRPILRTSAENGVARFGGIDGGLYEINIRQEGFEPYSQQVAVEEDMESVVEIRLRPEHRIVGIVQDAFGVPISGATLQAFAVDEAAPAAADEGDGRGRGGRRPDSWARSSEDGSFALGTLAAGTFSVRVERRGFVRADYDKVPVDTRLDPVLSPLGEIRGVVVSASTSAPIPAFLVVARAVRETAADAAGTEAPAASGEGADPGRGRGGRQGGFGGPGGGFGAGQGGGRPRRVEDPEGRFALDDIEPGRYEVEIFAEGFSSARATLEVAGGPATTETVFALVEGLSIRGAVVDLKTQKPIPGAELFLVKLADEIDAGAGAGATRGENPADRAGRAEDRRAAVETAIAERRARGGRRGDESADEALTAALSLLQSGASPVGATEADGTFELLDLVEGRYAVVVTHEAYVPSRLEIRLGNLGFGRSNTVRLVEGETLKGKISLADRSSAGGASLRFSDERGLTKTVTTDAKGRYRATGFIPGTYRLRVEHGGLRGPTVDVPIQKGDNEFDWEMPASE